MDEWQLEMQEIERNIAGLLARNGDPVIIDELEAEVRILRALYLAAHDLHDAGLVDDALRGDFEAIGMGDWTFGNVYSYVYENAIEIEPGRRELSSLVPELDYAGRIREAAR